MPCSLPHTLLQAVPRDSSAGCATSFFCRLCHGFLLAVARHSFALLRSIANVVVCDCMFHETRWGANEHDGARRNGRIAMLAIVIIVLVEMTTGQGIIYRWLLRQ